MYRKRKKRHKIDDDLYSSGFVGFLYKLIFFKFSFKGIMDGIVEEIANWRILVFDATRIKKLGYMSLSIFFHIVALIGINQYLSSRPKASIVSPNTVFEMNAIQLVDIAPIKAKIEKSSGGKPLEKPIKKVIKPGVPKQLASFSHIDKATLSPPTRPSSLSDYFQKATLVAQQPDTQVLPNTRARRMTLKPRKFKPVYRRKLRRPLPKVSRAKKRFFGEIVKPAKLVPKKTSLASAAKKPTSTPRKTKFPQRKLLTLTAKQREKIIKQAMFKKAKQAAKIKKIRTLTRLAKLLKVKSKAKAATTQKAEKKKLALPTDQQVRTLQKKLQKLAQFAKQKTPKAVPAPITPKAPKAKPTRQIEKEAIEAKLKALQKDVSKLLAAAKTKVSPKLPPKPLKKRIIVKRKKLVAKRQPSPRDGPAKKLTRKKIQLAQAAQQKIKKKTPQKFEKAKPTLKPLKELQRKLAQAKLKTEIKQAKKKLVEAKKKITPAPKPKAVKKKIVQQKAIVKKQLLPTAKPVKKLAQQKLLKLARTAKKQIKKVAPKRIEKAKPTLKPVKELQRKLAQAKLKTEIKQAKKKLVEAKKKVTPAPKPKAVRKKIIQQKEFFKKQLIAKAQPTKKLVQQKTLKLAQAAKQKIEKKIPQRIEKAKPTLKPLKELQRKLAQAKLKTEIKQAERKLVEAKKKVAPAPKPKITKKKIITQKAVAKKQLLPVTKQAKQLARQKILKLAQVTKQQVKKVTKKIAKAQPTLKPLKELQRKLAQAKLKTDIKQAERKLVEAKKKVTPVPKPKITKKKIITQKAVVKKQLLPVTKQAKQLARQKILKLGQVAKQQVKKVTKKIAKAQPTITQKQLTRRQTKTKLKTSRISVLKPELNVSKTKDKTLKIKLKKVAAHPETSRVPGKEIKKLQQPVTDAPKPLENLPKMVLMASAKKLSVTVKKEVRPEGKLKDLLKVEKQNRAEKSTQFYRADLTELRKSSKDLNFLKQESKVPIQKPKSKAKVQDSKVEVAKKNRQADELVAGKTSLVSDTLIKQPDHSNRLGGLTKSVKILGQDLETPSTMSDFVVETTKQAKADKQIILSKDHKKLAKAVVKNKLEYAEQEQKPRQKTTHVKVKAVNDSEAARKRKSTGPMDTTKTLSKISLEHRKEGKLSSLSQVPPKKKIQQKPDPLTNKLSLKSQTLTPHLAAGQKVKLAKLFNRSQNQTFSNKDMDYLEKSKTGEKTRLEGKKGLQTSSTMKNKEIETLQEGLAVTAFDKVDEIRFEQTAKQDNVAPSAKLEVDLPKRIDQTLEADKKLVISSFLPTPDVSPLKELPIKPEQTTLRNQRLAFNKISYLDKKAPKREKAIDIISFFDLEPEKAADTQQIKLKEVARKFTPTAREISQFETDYLKTDVVINYEKAEAKVDTLEQAEAVKKEDIKVAKLTETVKVKDFKVIYEQTPQKQEVTTAEELTGQAEQIEIDRLARAEKIVLAKTDQLTTRITAREQERVLAAEQQVTREELKREELAQLEQLKLAEVEKQVKEEIKSATGARVHDMTRLAVEKTAQRPEAAQAADLAAQAEKIGTEQLVQVEGIVLAKADRLTTRITAREQERVLAAEQQVTREELKREELAQLEQLKLAEVEKQVKEEIKSAVGARVHDLTRLAVEKTAQRPEAAQAADLAAQAEQFETEGLIQEQNVVVELAGRTEKQIVATETELPQVELTQEAQPSARKTVLELAYETQISQLGKMMLELEKKLAKLQTPSEKSSVQRRKTTKKALDLTSIGMEEDEEEKIEGEAVVLTEAAQEEYTTGQKIETRAETAADKFQQIALTRDALDEPIGKEEKIATLTTELVEITQIMKSLEYQAQMAKKTAWYRKTAEVVSDHQPSRIVSETYPREIKGLDQLLLETTDLNKTEEDLLASPEKYTDLVMAQLSEVSLPQADLLLEFSGEAFDKDFSDAMAYFKEQSAKEQVEFAMGTPAQTAKIEQEAIQYTQQAVYAQPRTIDKAADFTDFQESPLTGEQIDQRFEGVTRSVITPRAGEEQIPLVKNEISGDFVPFTEAEKISRLQSSGTVARTTPGDRALHYEDRPEISSTATIEQTKVKYKNLESSQHRRPTPAPENIQSDMKKFRDLSGEQASRSQSNLTEFSKKTFTYQEKAVGKAIEIGRHIQSEFPQAEAYKEMGAVLQSKEIKRVASSKQIEMEKKGPTRGRSIISKSGGKKLDPPKSKGARTGQLININIDRPSGNMTDQPLYTLTGKVGGKIKMAFITINKVTQIVPVLNGRFAAQITMRQGINSVSLVAFDPKGGIGKQSSQILFRPRIAGPAIKLLSPSTRTKGKEGDAIHVRGIINDRSIRRAILFLNNSPIRITVKNGEFRYKVYLPKGRISTFRVMAVNRRGGVGYSPLHTIVTSDDVFHPAPF